MKATFLPVSKFEGNVRVHSCIHGQVLTLLLDQRMLANQNRKNPTSSTSIHIRPFHRSSLYGAMNSTCLALKRPKRDGQYQSENIQTAHLKFGTR